MTKHNPFATSLQKKARKRALPTSRSLFGFEFHWDAPSSDFLPLLLSPASPYFLHLLEGFPTVSITLSQTEAHLEGSGLEDEHLRIIEDRLDIQQMEKNITLLALHGNRFTRFPRFLGACSACKLEYLSFDPALFAAIAPSIRSQLILTQQPLSGSASVPAPSHSSELEADPSCYYSTTDHFSLAALIAFVRVSRDFPVIDLSHLGLDDAQLNNLFQLLPLPAQQTYGDCTTLSLSGNPLQYLPRFLDRFDPHTLTHFDVSLKAFSLRPLRPDFGAPSPSCIKELIRMARAITASWPHVDLSEMSLKSKTLNCLARFDCPWQELRSLNLSHNPIVAIPLFFVFLKLSSCPFILDTDTDSPDVAIDTSASMDSIPPQRMTRRLARSSSTIMMSNYSSTEESAVVPLGPASSSDRATIQVSDTALISLTNRVLQQILSAILSNQLVISRLDLKKIGLSDATAALLPLKELSASLISLDLSSNDLTQIPTCLAWLNSAVFTTLHIDAAPMQGLDRTFVTALRQPDDQFLRASVNPHQPLDDIIAYAKTLLEGAHETIRELKLMVVGAAAVGKTSLIRNLRKESHSFTTLSTDGIDLGSLQLTKPGQPPITFHTWDFGGQPVYQYTHQLFYQSHAIYLLLSDVSLPLSQSLKDLHFWLTSIAARVGCHAADHRSWKIIIVATKCDRVPKKTVMSKILTLWQHAQSQFPDLPIAQDVFPVAIPVERGTKELANYIVACAEPLLQSAPSIIRRCLSHIRLLGERTCQGPFLEWVEFSRLLHSLFDRNSIKMKRRGDLMHIIPTILERLGSILLLRQQIASSTPLAVIVRPQWLAQLFASIITTKHLFVRQGLLDHKHLPHIWSDPELFPSAWHPSMIQLLQQSEVLFPAASPALESGPLGQSLLPSLLPEQPPNYGVFWPLCYRDDSHRQFWITSLPSLPLGFMPRLFCRFARYADAVLCCWAHGMIARFGTSLVFLLSTVSIPVLSREIADKATPCIVLRVRAVDPTTPITNLDRAKLLRLLTSMIEHLCTDYYRLRHCCTMPCVSDHCCILSEDVLLAMHTNQSSVTCRSQNPAAATHATAIAQIAGDMIFADLNRPDSSFILKWSDIDQHNKKLLGSGSFGEVVSASYEQGGKLRIPVAVKILNTVIDDFQSSVAVFSEFAKEAFTMASLSHPNIVRIYGVCLNPPGLVMQLIGGGTLFSLLNDPFHFEESFFKSVEDYLNNINRYHCDLNSHLTHPDRFPPPEPLPSFSHQMESAAFVAIGQQLDLFGTTLTDPQTANALSTAWATLRSCLQQYLAAPDPVVYHAALGHRKTLLAAYRAAFPLLSPISWDLRLKIAYDIALAMRHAHGLIPALVHRDLKSPNIFLSTAAIAQYDFSTPLAIVGDFGLSGQLFGVFRSVKGVNDAIDSILPLWAAPEVLDGKEYSTKSDVFSYGVILWELVARQTPWEQYIAQLDSHSFFDGFEAGVRPLVIAGQRLPIPPDTLEPFALLISNCWAHDPALRPDFQQVVTQLEAMIHTVCPDRFSLENANSTGALLPASNPSDGPAIVPATVASQVKERLYPVKFPLVRTFSTQQKIGIPCSKHVKSSRSGGANASPPSLGDASTATSLSCTSLLIIDDTLAWMGLSHGLMCAQVLQPDLFAASLLTDAHRNAIRSMCYSPVHGGRVWCVSASEISVWRAFPLQTEDYLTTIAMFGYLQCKTFSLLPASKAWVALDEAELRFYSDRFQGAAWKCIPISSIATLSLKNKEIKLILTDSSKVFLTEHHQSAEYPSLLAWFTVLYRLHAINTHQLADPHSGAYCLGWLAHLQPNLGFNSIQPSKGDHEVWSTSQDHVLREWRLSDRSQLTGTRCSFPEISQIRSISLDPTLGGLNHLIFVQEHQAWVASAQSLVSIDLQKADGHSIQLDIGELCFMALSSYYPRLQIGHLEVFNETFTYQIDRVMSLEDLPSGAGFVITVSKSGRVALWHPDTVSTTPPFSHCELSRQLTSVALRQLPDGLELWTCSDPSMLLFTNSSSLWTLSNSILQIAHRIV